MNGNPTKVTLIAGGVGGAKLAEGFAALPDIDLTIIGNVADDDEFHGLWVSPDIDTIIYSLSGLINREQGWGLADEGLRALAMLETLGQETWMTLGDKDLGLHIYRTMRRRSGERPTAITQDIARKLGIQTQIVLPTDDVVKTRVRTDQGWISFQEYFVKEKCQPAVKELTFEGIDNAGLTTEAAQAVANAELIIIAPSNPLVSIAPILNIQNLRQLIGKANAPVFAVSPLIDGKVVKGPADRMMSALGLRADSVGIAHFYREMLDRLYIDHADRPLFDEIKDCGIEPVCSDVMMHDLEDKKRMASQLLSDFLSLSKVQAA